MKQIKTYITYILASLLLHTLLYSAVPTGINYQGRYRENGIFITGTRAFQFRITNNNGTVVYWKSPIVNLQVEKGLFNYVLHCSTVDWAGVSPFFEVRVGPEGTTNENALTVLLPREQIMSSAYAFYASSATFSLYSSSASYADNAGLAENANKLGGQGPSYYLDTSAAAQTKSGDLSVNRLTANKLVLNSSTVTVNGVEMFFVPRGAIIMWSGSAANIPPGWALCDGTKGTPDLRDKFIIAAGGTYSPGATGGSATHTHTVDIAAFTSGSAGDHYHSIDPPATTSSSAGSHSHVAAFAADDSTLYWNRVAVSYTANYSKPVSGNRATGTYPMGYGISTTTDGAHTHTVDIAAFNSSTAGAHTHTIDPPATTSSSASNLPPYYALCFIMKL